ncbi:MAG: class I SAM-dependent methyltransferase [Limisphaerales bacterium]
MKAKIKTIIKQVCPDFLFHPVLRVRAGIRNWRLINAPAAKVFEDIYRNRSWPGTSVSGMGSDYEQTRSLRQELPKLLQTYSVGSLLDAPCGDFSWMKLVELGSRPYIGGDIVPELIGQNNAKYRSSNRRFCVLDLMKDSLPAADLLLCRDCLIHLSFRDVRLVFSNIAKSGIPYVLTTNYPLLTRNTDILTGGFRAINLQLSPFRLPKPVDMIAEDLFPKQRSDPNFIRELGLWHGSDFTRFMK